MKQLWHKTKVVRVREDHDGLLLHEEHRLPRLLVYPLMGFGALTVGANIETPLLAGRVLAALLFMGGGVVLAESFALCTEVDHTWLRFVVRPFYQRSIPVDEIVEWHAAKTEV